jgi:1,2-diacylglycerol 3-alpha-glucosyltransferase
MTEKASPNAQSQALNVCLMNDSFPPVIDGVANAVANYARIISGGLGRCAVATPEYPGAADDYPYPVVRYPSIAAGKLTAGYRAGYPFSPAALTKLAGMDFALIHTHCPFTSTMLARSLRERTGAPVVFTYHTKFDIDIARAVRGQLLQETAIRLLVSNIAACDEIWVVSEGAGENLRSLGYDGSYTVMPNGVDLPRGRAEEAAVRALDDAWNLPKDVPVYLFVGRIMWYKGLRLILDGLSMLRAAGRDFRMVFIGDGQDRPDVVKYADSLGLGTRCLFTGAIRDREAIRAWYCRADLLLFPSTFDTNGLVVREAAACGLGSLLVRGSCAAEGVADGRTGILIEENAYALCSALMAPGAGPQSFRRIGETAMREIYVSWDDSVRAAWERYGTVLEAWPGRKKKTLGALLDKSGSMQQAFETAKEQYRDAMAQLNRGVDRALGYLDRYL